MDLLHKMTMDSTEYNVFSPWGFDRSYDDATDSLVHQDRLSEYKKAFETAREHDGIGKTFEFDHQLHSTYYKDEWDGLLTEQKKEFLSHLPEIETGHDNIHLMPMASNVSEDMDLEDALFFAREEVGTGGLFMHNGQIYTTSTQEEIDTLSHAEKNHFLQLADNNHIHIIDNDLSHFDVVDLVFQDHHYDDNMEQIAPIENMNNNIWITEADIVNHNGEEYIAADHQVVPDHHDPNSHGDYWDGSDYQSNSNFNDLDHLHNNYLHEDHSGLDI